MMVSSEMTGFSILPLLYQLQNHKNGDGQRRIVMQRVLTILIEDYCLLTTRETLTLCGIFKTKWILVLDLFLDGDGSKVLLD